MECEYCKLIFKTKYTLKAHLSTNKTCLKIRGLVLDNKFACIACNQTCTSNINLNLHTEICKKFIVLKSKEEFEKNLQQEINDLILQHKKEILDKDKEINDLILQHKKEILDKDKEINDYKKEISYKNKEIKELTNSKDEKIKDLQAQLDKMFSTIEKLAFQAIDKPTGTTNVTNNNVRNIYSDKYFLDKLTSEEVNKKCQNYLTEQVFFGGQKGIAQMCSDHIIKTKDNKVLLTCSDVSRKKFKYMDENGNLKEDYEARTFTEKVFEPIKKVSQDVYENILLDIKDEQEREQIDYNRKSVLNDKTMKAIDCFSQIVNIDNPSCNSDFKNELAILNK